MTTTASSPASTVNGLWNGTSGEASGRSRPVASAAPQTPSMNGVSTEAQAKILSRFHFALRREGYLFLGKAETLLSHGGNFRPEDLKNRLFQRAAATNLRERLLARSDDLRSREARSR